MVLTGWEEEKEDDSDYSIDIEVKCVWAQKVLCWVEPLLDDSEVRVRLSVAEALSWTIPLLSESHVRDLLGRVKGDITKRLAEPDVETMNDCGTQSSVIKLNEDMRASVAENGEMNKAADENAIESSTVPSIDNAASPSMIRHETMGWHSLETSIRSLSVLGVNLGQYISVILDLDCLVEMCEATQHVNRHVREAALLTLSSFSSISKDIPAWEELSRPETGLLSVSIVRCLADNWSQVRHAATVTTRSFLESSSYGKEAYYPTYLPPLCLNRYYVAEGVRNLSQKTWVWLVGENGQRIVGDLIKVAPEWLPHHKA